MVQTTSKYNFIDLTKFICALLVISLMIFGIILKIVFAGYICQ